MQIRLILLDFDGTLADTRRANAAAYAATLREAGYTLTEAEYEARYFGMRCEEFLTRFGIDDPVERERLRRRKIEPLWNFCRQFRQQGGRVWIVSTGSRANIENAMRFLGIGGPENEKPSDDEGAQNEKPSDDEGPENEGMRTTASESDAPKGRVDGILAGTDIAASKPAPDCFLEAMRREGCTPSETLIFEDSAIGLEAARRSGAAYFQVKKGAIR